MDALCTMHHAPCTLDRANLKTGITFLSDMPFHRLAGIEVQQIMDTPVKSLKEVERRDVVERLLDSVGHNGFPVRKEAKFCSLEETLMGCTEPPVGSPISVLSRGRVLLSGMYADVHNYYDA